MSSSPTNRTIDDLPKELVDHFRPRLTNIFNEVTEYGERLKKDPSLDQDAGFAQEVADTVKELQTISEEFMLVSGGDEEGFLIIAEAAAKNISPPQP